MTDKVQKIREEVVRMHNLLPVMDGDNISVNYADRICTTLEMYIDSLQEEPVSEDLVVATNNYCVNVRKGYPRVMDETDRYICNAFKAGAKWQKEQLITVGDRTMSKAEKFISEHTRNCSNVFVNPQLGGTEENHPWLTPDQARRVAEIAREETIKEVCEWIKYNNENGGCSFDGWENDLKKHLNSKV